MNKSLKRPRITRVAAALATAACSSTAGHVPPPPSSSPSAGTINEDATSVLIERSQEANDALVRGDGARYGALVPIAADFTLMSPFGGKPSRGSYSPERLNEIGRFFKNGTLRQELVQAYSSPDMITLATIEHVEGLEAGGLPAQDWSLRVTLVYRRVGSEWQLVHRHADPLAHGISLERAAVLGRGAQPAGDAPPALQSEAKSGHSAQQR